MSSLDIASDNPQYAVQVITEDKVFNNAIMQYVQRATGTKVGLNYHVISVFGSQSTGKSTLLNTLFNTKFDVMDQNNRQQTTKGIWMAYASHVSTTDPENSSNSSNIFVMDVEGTDGRERGEDQDFERKAALFALSTSEVLIVNVWENQVGLYQGANLGLLKTVFEVNLSLFANQKHKCLLLFVIRDHLGVTPLENLGATLKQDLEKIWRDLNKPKGTELFSLYDFFDLHFHALGHKILQPEKFVADIKLLGDDFNIETNKSYIFKDEYHRDIPVDGWTLYAEKCWEQIELNKDLDLPTQQILVARFRCDEIANIAYEQFESAFSATIPRDLSIADASDLGNIFKKLQSETLVEYDISASRYNKSVYEERRHLLQSKVGGKLREVFASYLIILKKSALALFTSTLKSKNKSETFLNGLKKAEFTALLHFQTNADLSSIDHQLVYTTELADLKSSLEEISAQARKAELEGLVTRTMKKFAPALKEKVLFLLSTPNKSTWDNILESFNQSLNSTISKYEVEDNMYDFGVGSSNEENHQLYTNIRKSAWIKLSEIIQDFVKEDNLATILRDRFEEKFRFDDEGVPRFWKNADEIDIVYRIAKEYALSILPTLSIAELNDGTEIIPDVSLYDEDADEDEYDEVPRFAHILSAKQRDHIGARFKKQADVIYIEAKRATIQSITQIPYYIYIIIAVLGWNEFVAILRNPLFFTLLLVLGAASYITYTLNLTGPLMSIVNAMVQETVSVAKEKLKGVLVDDSHTPVAVPANHNYSKDKSEKYENIEMVDLNDKH